jgi:hypothetical protein
MGVAIGVGVGLGFAPSQGVAPPVGYAWVSTQGGTQYVTTNNGADRATVKVS